MILASVALTDQPSLVVVTIAQVVLALLVVARRHPRHPPAARRRALDDPHRGGLRCRGAVLDAFLPFALAFGLVSSGYGVHTAGWMITAITVIAGALLVKLSLRRSATTDTGSA